MASAAPRRPRASPATDKGDHIMTAAALPYARITDRMLAGPEALPRGAASVSFSRAFPITNARCADQAISLEWVPDRERAVVPGSMAALCRSCTDRPQCLLSALAANADGYWAGSTTADRHQLAADGEVSVERVDALQDQARAAAAADARHDPGEGSYLWYRRRGCRCAECREANAEQRADERAKARLRADIAA